MEAPILFKFRDHKLRIIKAQFESYMDRKQCPCGDDTDTPLQLCLCECGINGFDKIYGKTGISIEDEIISFDGQGFADYSWFREIDDQIVTMFQMSKEISNKIIMGLNACENAFDKTTNWIMQSYDTEVGYWEQNAWDFHSLGGDDDVDYYATYLDEISEGIAGIKAELRERHKHRTKDPMFVCDFEIAIKKEE